jgi:hypothetical protein
MNINSLTETIRKRYAQLLTRHFQEEFDETGNLKTGKFIGHDVRQGVKTRLSEHLIVLWDNQFSNFETQGILPRPIFRSDFYRHISSNQAGGKTIFERLNILDDKGNPYSFSPHQIRRWITTNMYRSGVPEHVIDLWMGRTPRQSRVYDYRTAQERAELIREKYTDSETPPNDYLGRKVTLWREDGLSEGNISSLVSEKLRALHYTPWGTCSKELYLSPCTKGLMCLRGFGTGSACSSFQIDPNDFEAKDSILQLRAKYLLMLNEIQPNYKTLSADIFAELNSSEPLDQHIQFIIDLISGCDSALKAYDINQNLISKEQ